MLWYFLKLLLTSFAMPRRFTAVKDPGVVGSFHFINTPNADKYTADMLPPWGPLNYRAVANAGYNGLRFMVFWSHLEPRRGEYDQAYLNGLCAHLQMACDAGLSVILDMHQDLYSRAFADGDGFPLWATDTSIPFKAQKAWNLNYWQPAVIANYRWFWLSPGLQSQYLAAVDTLLTAVGDKVFGIDLMNEPWGGPDPEFEHDRLRPLYDRLLSMLLTKHPDVKAICEPMMYTSAGCLESRLTSAGDVLSPHFYDPWLYLGLPYTWLNRVYMRYCLNHWAAKANRMNTSLWIGEYGCPAKVKNRDRFVTDFQNECKKRSIGWAYYQLQ